MVWFLQGLNNDILESHDDIYSYIENYKTQDLQRDFWSIVGGHKNFKEYEFAGQTTVKKLIEFGLKPNSKISDIGNSSQYSPIH